MWWSHYYVMIFTHPSLDFWQAEVVPDLWRLPFPHLDLSLKKWKSLNVVWVLWFPGEKKGIRTCITWTIRWSTVTLHGFISSVSLTWSCSIAVRWASNGSLTWKTIILFKDLILFTVHLFNCVLCFCIVVHDVLHT